MARWKGESIRERLLDIYGRLFAVYGPQHWWPGTSDVETVVGAILTQNTAWTNVERAIAGLKEASLLDWERLREVRQDRLARVIHSCGTYRVKAVRLKSFVDRLWSDHEGELGRMLDGPLVSVRQRLLSIKGIGEETADAILLYVGKRRSFVVDAYTRRVLKRHFLIDGTASYDEVRRLFHRNLPKSTVLYNEYHALLVAVGKRHCRRKALCADCPLQSIPHDDGSL